MADKPDLEIVLPDGRPVSEFQEPQEDMGTVVEIGIGGEGGLTVEVDLPDGEDFYENLVDEFDDEDRDLEKIASDLMADFDGDLSARKDWLQIYIDGLELLGLKIEDRSEPWAGACAAFTIHYCLKRWLSFNPRRLWKQCPPVAPLRPKLLAKKHQKI